MGARRKARECALQMLFQYDLSRQPVNELIQTYWGELAEAAEDVREFANELVAGAISHLTEIDDRIRLRTEHWRISRMAVVDRNLLRLAVYEFMFQDSTPKTVAINEALEIARRFSTHEATQFVNGILDAIKRDMEGDPSPPGGNDDAGDSEKELDKAQARVKTKSKAKAEASDEEVASSASQTVP